MPDWKLFARARGMALSETDLDSVAASLDALDAALELLAREIPHETEPAVILSDAAVAGE